MTQRYINPYINFQGRAREALAFYQKALGGTLELKAADEHGKLRPAEPNDPIQWARLDADGARIVGTDGHPKFAPTVGENMAVALGGSDGEGMTRIFTALAEGGKIKGSLAPNPGSVGYLLDKFGINWVVSIEVA